MTWQRDGFCCPFSPSAAFPSRINPRKTLALLAEESAAQGVHIQPTWSSASSFLGSYYRQSSLWVLSGGGDSAPHCVTLKERVVQDKWTSFRSPLWAAQFSCSEVPSCTVGDMLLFRGLLGTVTNQGLDASSQGSHLSSPHILPCQISGSGWGWSAANNCSIAPCGVRSAEESTITCKKEGKKQEVKIKGIKTDCSINELWCGLYPYPAQDTLCIPGVYRAMRPAQRNICSLIAAVKSLKEHND